MSISIFPEYATLLLDGYSEEHEKSIRRTEFESGLPRQSQTKSRALHFRNVSYHLCSRDEYKLFLSWYENDIKRGAFWFLWIDPIDGDSKRARIVDGEIKWDAQEKRLDRWKISFRLETWSQV